MATWVKFHQGDSLKCIDLDKAVEIALHDRTGDIALNFGGYRVTLSSHTQREACAQALDYLRQLGGPDD